MDTIEQTGKHAHPYSRENDCAEPVGWVPTHRATIEAVA